MADKWSVALFGHYKPRYELREKEKTIVELPLHDRRNQFVKRWQNKCVGRFVDLPTDFDTDKYFVYNVTGWEKRAEPGDIIDCKHLKDEDKWTPLERKHFLIVTIEGPDLKQMTGGVIEPYWDMKSYGIPLKESEYEGTLDYEEYLKDFTFPMSHSKKRRMTIQLSELQDRGFDTEQMLSKETLYCPLLDPIPIVSSYDKRRRRRVQSSDGFNPIRPLLIDDVIRRNKLRES